MRRVSKGARAAVAGALGASLLCVVALARLANLPPVAAALAPPGGEASLPRLVVATPEGLLVVEAESAFRLSPHLQRTPLGWPAGVHVDNVLGAAYGDDTLAIAYRQGVTQGVFLLGPSEAMTPIEVSGENRYLGLHAEAGGFVVFTVRGGRLLRGWLEGGTPVTWAEAKVAPNLHLDAVEGILWQNNEPLLLVGERGAHWLVGFDGKLHQMPERAPFAWSASSIPQAAGLRSARAPFLDEDGVAHAFGSGVGYPAFTVEGERRLMALSIDRGADEPGVMVSTQHDRRLELRVQHHRLAVSTPEHVGWRPVASTTSGYELAAFPLPASDLWIALSADAREAVALSSLGARLEATSAAATVAALTGRPLEDWLALLGLLAMFVMALPLFLLRTARALKLLDQKPARADEPNARGVLYGSLRLQPGTVIYTDRRGFAQLKGACTLQAGGVELELAPSPRRHDFEPGRPLVDGEQVYMVGEVLSDGAGGPMRASHRKRLQPLRGLYLLGRGGAAAFEEHLLAHENASLIRFALVHLSLALVLLGFLALRPLA